jgi:hypothetical protein
MNDLLDERRNGSGGHAGLSNGRERRICGTVADVRREGLHKGSDAFAGIASEWSSADHLALVRNGSDTMKGPPGRLDSIST